MKSVNIRARASVLSLALAAAFPVSAQSESVGALGEVVVTATRNPQLVSAVAAHTTVITREDIEESQAVDLVTLLAREVGIQRVQTGGMGAPATAFVRGLPSINTLVLLDGVPQLGLDNVGSPRLENIMLENVERIEIVRGNVSALYGSGAIGGVIQIFTRSAKKEPSLSLSTEAGPRGTGRLSAQASTVAGATAVSVGISRQTTDGFPNLNSAQFPDSNQSDHGYQNNSSSVSLTHRISPDHLVGLQTSQSEGLVRFASEYGIATDTAFSSASTHNTNLFMDNKFGDWRSKLSFSSRSQAATNAFAGSFTGSVGGNTHIEGIEWVNTHPLGDSWLATVGVNGQRQHIDTTDADPTAKLYNKDRSARALFAGIEGALGPFSAQVNARNDVVGNLEKSTGYLGGGYALSDRFKLIASYSTAFNAPPLGYLYDPWAGNPALQPESARSSEIGLQYAGSGQLVRATYFETSLENQLYYDPSTYTFTNLARTRNSGLELSYKGSVGSTKLQAALTMQNPVNEVSGNTLRRRAKTMLDLGLTQPVGAFSLGTNLHFVGETNDSPDTAQPVASRTLGAFTVIDLTAGYAYSKEVKLTARLANATDRSYQTAYGYNQEPRSLYVGVVWTPRF